jgi:hypothetical protein
MADGWAPFPGRDSWAGMQRSTAQQRACQQLQPACTAQHRAAQSKCNSKPNPPYPPMLTEGVYELMFLPRM